MYIVKLSIIKSWHIMNGASILCINYSFGEEKKWGWKEEVVDLREARVDEQELRFKHGTWKLH